VVVVGHLEHHIRNFLDTCAGDLEVVYVCNPVYQTTNNIYSLWLAGSEIHEPFLLIESDLIFEATLLDGLLVPDKIAISHMLPWMNGTTITMDASGHVDSFDRCTVAPLLLNGGTAAPREHGTYKTVNICSLSTDTWSRVLTRLERVIANGGMNEYYEVVFAEMIYDGSLSLDCVLFDADRWYEVDRLEDVVGAERMAGGYADHRGVRFQ
jgi:NDP-sugar pyrophosphorylase family protein